MIKIAWGFIILFLVLVLILIIKNNIQENYVDESKKPVTKNIFIYWDQKFINAPEVVKKCVLSWKLKNPTWKIIELDKDNLKKYINIEENIDIKKKKFQKHIIRIL